MNAIKLIFRSENPDISHMLKRTESVNERYQKLLDRFGDKVRMNDSTGHIIFFAVPVPKIPGFRDTEVVVGMRNTEFQPYVAWLSFDGVDYAYGDYCQTLDDVFECANEKFERESRYFKH